MIRATGAGAAAPAARPGRYSMMITMTLDAFVVAVIGPAVMAAFITWFYMEDRK